MNFSLFVEMFYPLLFLFLLVFFIRWIKSRKANWVGSLGEYRVRKEIEMIEKSYPSKYKAFHDLYIPKKDGSTSQIDHLILSEQGLFVIETKNYSGWIFGDEASKYWTQVIYKRKEKFLNPIWQNKGHIKALKEWLGGEVAHIPIYSIVVFMPRAKLKSGIHFTQSHVIYPKQLKQVLEKYRTKVIDNETKQYLVQKLKTLLVKDKQQEKEMKKQHIQSIQTKQKYIKEHVQQNQCPKCGSALVLKKGKYGSFKSCSNYPKCRFTQKAFLNMK
ncbi:NERD domain-containing protein [Thermaerobacillus caldiproteolyticus]|uniref:NERD domain-containing protein n=1 Tax=Thermaerobacillus caldiproteolyticus TaxID=247480 RepID=UPI00188DC269|nr:NERD domain-containing protein [Anoxybacillus caldiproteolyticus]QPA32282.1 NERD domain-containing protein [Anoxybacillus caldiproteolyticus]